MMWKTSLRIREVAEGEEEFVLVLVLLFEITELESRREGQSWGQLLASRDMRFSRCGMGLVGEVGTKWCE